MTIQAIRVSMMGTNCYLLKDDKTGKGAIIDPGGDKDAVVAAAANIGMTPVAIFLTHGHYDHTGAVVELAEYYGGIPAYLHENDAARTKIPFSLMPDIGETVHYGEGDEIAVGNLTVHVYHTPGHSSGSVVLECEDVLFTGDTLFQGSCGRTDLPGGSMDEILISLKRLAEMEGDRKVYPGHEGFSNLDAERKGNYYMLLGMKQ